MIELQLNNNLTIAVQLRRSAQARRISLRISRLDGRVTMTVPRSVREKAALEFLHTQRDWLHRHVSAAPALLYPQFNADFPIDDIPVRLAEHTLKAPVFKDNILFLRHPLAPQLIAFLKDRARTRLTRESDYFAQQAGCAYRKITLRDTRSRWGSCNSNKELMYSWRLIMAPPRVLSYVAAHEVAHLREMNHGPDFWRLVAQLNPDYAQAQAWLRTNGARLHRWRFD